MPARTTFLLHGEDSFRTRLRLAELVRSLLVGGAGEGGDLALERSADLGAPLGLTRLDARADEAASIEQAGQARSLFDAEERRVVVVEHAEVLRDLGVIARFPTDAALVLVAAEALGSSRPRRGSGRAKAPSVPPASLPDAVRAAGGRVERIGRLFPDALPAWIEVRARLYGTVLAPDAVAALAGLGADTERLEHELAKLAAYAQGARVTGADVATLVSGAIETDVFELTQAVVRRDAATAVDRLERLLADGQAVQQILALLVWQFRVLLFASAMRTNDDAERMAKAIRSSPGAIARWSAFAKRVNRADVLRAYEALYATDLVVKTGRAESDEVALLLCVLDLCGVAGADPRALMETEPPRR